ncbi:MAG TPA: ankyrin repeat domain-containing protein, partial [Leptospiraceae bacterium]|nr:ankyrin repeat domain-containing protein [Leptospiraceae bacterium]
KNGNTPLHNAAESDDLDTVKYLIEKGADIRIKDKDGNTPLHKAAESGELNIVKYLIQKGADVNAKNNQGFTASEWGEKKRVTAPAEYLKSSGDKK